MDDQAFGFLVSGNGDDVIGDCLPDPSPMNAAMMTVFVIQTADDLELVEKIAHKTRRRMERHLIDLTDLVRMHSEAKLLVLSLMPEQPVSEDN